MVVRSNARISKRRSSSDSTKKSPSISRLETGRWHSDHPPDVFDALVVLDESGVASFRGISFDLNPDRLLHQGWRSPTRIGIDMGGGTGPIFVFPWSGEITRSLTAQEQTFLNSGDHVHVHQIEHHHNYTDLNHQSDAEKLLVTLAVRRGRSITPIKTQLEYFRATTFSSFQGVSFLDAVRRVHEVLGLSHLDISREGVADIDVAIDLMEKRRAALKAWPSDRPKRARNYAERANSAIEHITVMKYLDIDCYVNRLLSSFPTIRNQKRGLREFTEFLRLSLDHHSNCAVAIGYWLAKAEFAPHVDDTLIGKKRRSVSREAGKRRAAQIIKKADMQWREQALKFARQIRTKHPNYGQKALADEVLTQLAALQARLPETDTVIRQIREWERFGSLPRSTAYGKAFNRRGDEANLETVRT